MQFYNIPEAVDCRNYAGPGVPGLIRTNFDRHPGQLLLARGRVQDLLGRDLHLLHPWRCCNPDLSGSGSCHLNKDSLHWPGHAKNQTGDYFIITNKKKPNQNQFRYIVLAAFLKSQFTNKVRFILTLVFDYPDPIKHSFYGKEGISNNYLSFTLPLYIWVSQAFLTPWAKIMSHAAKVFGV